MIGRTAPTPDLARPSSIEELLSVCAEKGGSDVHLSSGEPPRLRLHGRLRPMSANALSEGEVESMLLDILDEGRLACLRAGTEIDYSLEHSFGRFRVNIFSQSRGLGAVFRLIPRDVPTIESLSLPSVFRDLCAKSRGLVLVTGPTGSGKSTTLAAMVDEINRAREEHILTIEDPIEFVHPSKKSLVNHREVGTNTESFAHALRAALREDPDVILVGEMRDLETIHLALTAAETGHLVLGTLHSSSASQTVDRIIDVFPAGQQNQVRMMLAESLIAVIAQVLVPRRDGAGRVAAHEIMVATSGVRNLIRDGKTSQIVNAMQTGRQHGMQSLDAALTTLVQQRVIDLAEAERRARDPAGLRKLTEGRGAAPPPPPAVQGYGGASRLAVRRAR